MLKNQHICNTITFATAHTILAFRRGIIVTQIYGRKKFNTRAILYLFLFFLLRKSENEKVESDELEI